MDELKILGKQKKTEILNLIYRDSNINIVSTFSTQIIYLRIFFLAILKNVKSQFNLILTC